MVHRILCLAVTVAVSACGAESTLAPDNSTDPNAIEELPVPFVDALTPSRFSLGQRISVFGSGFASPSRGATELHLRGTFTPQAGTAADVDVVVPLHYVNPGLADFVFEAGHAPSGFGDTIGTFNGYGWAVSRDHDGVVTGQTEAPHLFALSIAPSIAVWAFGPDTGTCEKPTSGDSVVGTKFNLSVQLLGFALPTVYNPITVEVLYAPVAGGDFQRQTFSITSGDTLDVAGIDFGPLPDDVLTGTGSVSVSAHDTEGTTVTRAVSVLLHRELYVEYDGNINLAETYDAAAVSGCISGGEYGRSVNYTESSGETRSRSVAINAGAGLTIIPSILNLSFGINVSESISSNTSQSLAISGHVIPRQYGVFYRQTQRLLRRGTIVQFSSCGVKNPLGEALVTDWTWAPDLAITNNGVCPPFPDTNLQAATLYLE
jgi:hypothetical protein